MQPFLIQLPILGDDTYYLNVKNGSHTSVIR